MYEQFGGNKIKTKKKILSNTCGDNFTVKLLAIIKFSCFKINFDYMSLLNG